jgi:alkanesulfonate monooxygenase SsuD/methylene tetrahydromethanopterin reductase-like flavin-dependent oxidoreductase (luciferase family)
MKFGYGLISAQRHPGDPRGSFELVQEALELAEYAEELGFDSVWFSEHHFFDDGYLPSLLPMAAAAAARTSTIAVGTGLLLAPIYDPVRLAEDAAVVDLLSDGRLLLGVGKGFRPEEFEAFDVPLRGLHHRVEDVVTVLREAWGDGLVRGGDTLSYPGVFPTPKPRRQGGPPILLGGFEEGAIRRAGRIGDGFIAAEVTPESYPEQVRWVRESLAARDDAQSFQFLIAQPTFARENDAWEVFKPYRYHSNWKYDDMFDSRGRVAGALPSAPPLTDEHEAKLLRESVVGEPGAVVEEIMALRDVAGDDLHYIAWLYWPGMSADLRRESMRLFATEVIPKLR